MLFTGVLDIVSPLKEFRVKQNTEPWMTSEILNLIKERDNLFIQYKQFSRSEDYKHFCLKRNKVQREVKKARSQYFSDKIEENKDDPKKLWKQLKDLGYKGKTQESSTVLKIENEICHDSKTIANYINKFSLLLQRKF